MKELIRSTLEHATALDEELRLIREALGKSEGEQTSEAKTERQLDRWAQERGLGETIDTAVKHMANVLEAVKLVSAELDE
jgi:hypothetical protein